MIAIHKPTIDDYDAVRALVAQVHALHHAARSDVYAADAHFLPEHYAALLSDANAFPIAAYDGDKLVGFASAFMKPANPNPAMLPHRIAYIDDICVHSDCRGMGIGTAFVLPSSRAEALFGRYRQAVGAYSFQYIESDSFGRKERSHRTDIGR